MIASYGVETLGKKNWALVHSTDAFGTSGNNLLAAAIGKHAPGDTVKLLVFSGDKFREVPVTLRNAP